MQLVTRKTCAMDKPLTVLLHNQKTAQYAAMLKQDFPHVTVIECNDYAGVSDAVEHHRPEVVYTVRFAGSDGFPRDALMSAKWIANGGAGTDHLGLWDTSRTTVTNGAGVAADMMAEYIMGCFLHFMLDVPGLQRDKAERVWAQRTVRPVSGKTVLIVGLGHTGRAVAKRAKAFGMHVVGTRAHPVDMENVDVVGTSDELLSLLPSADFVAVCTPLTPATRGLINASAIAAMKRGVILADVSRGGVIVQDALLAALLRGHIGAAALDVFETEPLPPTSAFWDVDNLIISPHCSSVHEGWEQASFALFMKNLKLWMSGQPLMNVVDPNRGY